MYQINMAKLIKWYSIFIHFLSSSVGPVSNIELLYFIMISYDSKY